MAKYTRKEKTASYYKKNTEAGIVDHTQKMMQAIVLGSKKDFVFHHSKGGDLGFVDDLGFSALLLALQKGQTEIAKYILGHKKEINIFHQTYVKGYNALHCAINGSCCSLIEALSIEVLLAGKTTNGDTALHIATEKNDIVGVQKLVANGMAVDEQNNRGVTALMLAAKQNNISKLIFDTVLNETEQVDKKDEVGYTALMRAVESGRYEFVKVLIEKGADPDIVARNGKTAFTIAKAKSRNDLVKLMAQEAICERTNNY